MNSNNNNNKFLEAQEIFLLFQESRQNPKLVKPPIKMTIGFLPRVKRLGRTLYHSILYTEEVKNEWSYTSVIPRCVTTPKYLDY